MHTKSR